MQKCCIFAPTKHDAGWSSPVARWAHNPKVGGSNPPPATKRRFLSLLFYWIIFLCAACNI